MNTPQRVDVERFTVYGDASIRRSENGNFVKHEAYAALLQQLADYQMAASAEAQLADERGETITKLRAKLAEQAAEIERFQSTLARRTDAIHAWKDRAEAAERAREESVELMREVLERDRVRYLNGECVCINHSRKAELEYESGTCPHQRIAAFLAANGGRDE